MSRLPAGGGDERLLRLGRQVDETRVPAADANLQIRIFLRLPLRPAQGLRIEDVELDRLPASGEKGTLTT